MKSKIIITAFALLAGVLFTQASEPLTSESIREAYNAIKGESSNATNELKREYITSPEVFAHIQALRQSQDELSSQDQSVIWSYVYLTMLWKVPTAEVDVVTLQSWLDRIPHHATARRFALLHYGQATEVAEWAAGVENARSVVASVSRRLSNPQLLDSYNLTTLGKGFHSIGQQRYFSDHLRGLANDNARIEAIRTEIRGLVTSAVDPRYEDRRNEWLVELRGRLAILQEIQ